MPVCVPMCAWLYAFQRDRSAPWDFGGSSGQPVVPSSDEQMDGRLFASWAFCNVAASSVIEKVAWLCCLGTPLLLVLLVLLLLPLLLPIMQLQNRKTNSGNRPQNVINFVKGWAVGPVTGYYYCRRKTPNQLQIPSCLVSVTVANYKWTPRYSFTSFAAPRMDLRLVLQSSRRSERAER